MSVYDAATTGDTRQALEAMRDSLAEAMDLADPAVKAQLSGQLVKVLTALDALPPSESSVIDELANRRKDRRATAKQSPRPRARKQG